MSSSPDFPQLLTHVRNHHSVRYPNRSLNIRLILLGLLYLSFGLVHFFSSHSPLSAIEAEPTLLGPVNDLASQHAIKITVAEQGIQVVSAQALADAGIDLTILNPEMLQLYLGSEGIALTVNDANGNNLLEPDEQIRFYAPTPGDRWNSVDVYWLVAGESAGKRMGVRSAMPDSAPIRTTALERGVWEKNQLYESTMPGVDGDHWFARCMKGLETTPDDPCYPVYAITLDNRLPLALESTEASTFALSGASRSIGEHQLAVDVGGERWIHYWSSQYFYENWQVERTTLNHSQQISLTPSSVSHILIDKIHWQQPVMLDFGEKGAAFSGGSGTWQYQLSNTPVDRTLYDVTDPQAPVILLIPDGTSPIFEDSSERDYLLSGPGIEHLPVVVAHTPVDFSDTSGADTVYIAPAHFMDELAPLVGLRESQGYVVDVVDVADIYDAWSHGSVSPDAIRNFLRFAKSDWSRKPIAAVLVGDGTSDPRNYRGMLDGDHNRNIIPPYLANVDPWIGETACENCYAQLDGDDPLDSTDQSFLIDVWIGRLSVQDEAQLATVVDKIVRYETATDLEADWRKTAVFIADDYIRQDGSVDLAGDFAAQSDEIINDWLPSTAIVERMYYDPRPGDVTDPWREPDATVAHQKSVELLSAGAGLVTMTGHASHFTFAQTDRQVAEPWLFNIDDVSLLTNKSRPFVSLQMTSYTSQFTRVERTGSTLDERLLRHGDGARWPFGAVRG